MFTIFKNKKIEEFQSHSMPKGMDASWCKVFFKCKSYEIDYAELSAVFKKYLLLKSSFYEKVAVRKK